jgi:sarcosine oxidase, subunit alpha
VGDGLNRIGEVVAVPIPMAIGTEKVLRVTICDAVFIDKENIRRDS